MAAPSDGTLDVQPSRPAELPRNPPREFVAYRTSNSPGNSRPEGTECGSQKSCTKPSPMRKSSSASDGRPPSLPSAYHQYIREGGCANFSEFLLSPYVAGISEGVGFLHEPYETDCAAYFRYAPLVARYQQLFGRNRTFVGTMEGLFKDDGATLRRLGGLSWCSRRGIRPERTARKHKRSVVPCVARTAPKGQLPVSVKVSVFTKMHRACFGAQPCGIHNTEPRAKNLPTTAMSLALWQTRESAPRSSVHFAPWTQRSWHDYFAALVAIYSIRSHRGIPNGSLSSMTGTTANCSGSSISIWPSMVIASSILQPLGP